MDYSYTLALNNPQFRPAFTYSAANPYSGIGTPPPVSSPTSVVKNSPGSEKYMGRHVTGPIPDDVLQEAWRLFLWEGESFQWISKMTEIPTTTIFNLLKGKAKEHPDYPLMRSLAVNLRKHRWDPYKFAAGIRIDTLLAKYGIDPIDGENLIEKLLAECYKAKWTPSEAIANLQRFIENASVFGNSPSEHAEHVNKVLHVLHDSNRKLEENRQEIAKLIHSKSVIEKNLDIFLTQGGVILSDATERMAATQVSEENTRLRKELQSYRSGQPVDKAELEKLNKRLITPTTEQHVLDISNDVRLNPSKYSALFQTGISRLATKFEPFQDDPSEVKSALNKSPKSEPDFF